MHMIHLKTHAFSKCRLVRSNCFFYNHSENKSFSSPLLQHEISVNYYLILHVFCRVIKTIYFYKNVNSKILTFIKKPNAARFPIVSVDIISPNDNTLVL